MLLWLHFYLVLDYLPLQIKKGEYADFVLMTQVKPDACLKINGYEFQGISKDWYIQRNGKMP